jgi:peptide/nickel transport system substrate-binding protein
VLRRFAISCIFAAALLPAVARTRPHYGGALRVEIEGDPWQRPDGIARRLVYDGLTSLGADSSVQPALASDWTSDNNGHRWQMRLRAGVHFQDGSPLNSAAVVASLTASCTTACPWATVRAVGSTVVFSGDSPMPNLPALLADDPYLISLTTTADGKTAREGIGTGPFIVTEFNNGILTLSANENCWRGRPFIDSIEIHVRRSIHDQWLDLGLGRADVVEIPAEQMRQAQQQHFTIASAPQASLLALQISDTGALSNQKLRAAIAFAVDRGALYNVIFQKQGQITASLLPQAMTGYSFLFPPDRDLNKAHALRGGQTVPMLTLRVEGNGAMQLAAQRIALNLGEAGFSVQVKAASPQYGDLTLKALPFDGVEPSAILESILRSVGQDVPVVERTPPELYRHEQDFLEQRKLIPLLNLPKAYAVGPRVRDFGLQPDGMPDLAGVSLGSAQ